MTKKNTVTQDKIDEIFKKSKVSEFISFGKCLIVSCQLPNGFIIVENSACVDVANFDKVMGRDICTDRIKNKIWELEGYKLQCELSTQ